MKRSSFLLLVMVGLAVIAASCDSDRGTNSTLSLNYPQESTDMALFYSEQMEAPVPLVWKIDHELTLIRSQWRERVPVVETHFRLPWRRSTIYLTVDTTIAEAILNGTYEPVQRVLARNRLSVRRHLSYTNVFQIAFNSEASLNSERLVEEFIGVPGIAEAATDPFIWPFDNVAVRSVEGNDVHYFFQTEACPDLYHRFDHFVVSSNKARHVGTHWQCPPNADSVYLTLPLDQFFKWFDAWVDSAGAAAPEWIVDAEMALHAWSYQSGLHWVRGSGLVWPPVEGDRLHHRPLVGRDARQDIPKNL